MAMSLYCSGGCIGPALKMMGGNFWPPLFGLNGHLDFTWVNHPTRHTQNYCILGWVITRHDWTIEETLTGAHVLSAIYCEVYVMWRLFRHASLNNIFVFNHACPLYELCCKQNCHILTRTPTKKHKNVDIFLIIYFGCYSLEKITTKRILPLVCVHIGWDFYFSSWHIYILKWTGCQSNCISNTKVIEGCQCEKAVTMITFLTQCTGCGHQTY